MSFELVQGIDIPSAAGLENAYSENKENAGCFSALLSAELIFDFLKGFTELIPEPVFFFLEIPCTADEEKEIAAKGGEDRPHYRLYYLDNCTKPVISAILKNYGSLLINDGVCRFGFGGNESGDEVYVQSYKVISVYCSDNSLKKRTVKLFEDCGAKRTEELVTPWEIISKENPGVCVRAEEDGISLFDLPEILADAGMYFAEIV